MSEILDSAYDGCSFLWVTSAGAAEITANSIASLQRIVAQNKHPFVVGVLDAESESIISALVCSPDLKFLHLHKSADWMSRGTDVSKDYVDWGTAKFRFTCMAKYIAIRTVLQDTGKSVIFADGDIVYLRNPLDHFLQDAAVDHNKILVQNDRSFEACNQNLFSQYRPGQLPDGSEICAGFTVWRPTAAHLRIANYICKRITADISDQPIFNGLPFWKGRHVQLLRQDLFPNGSLIWGRPEFGRPSLKLEGMYIAHANWRLGLDAKIRALKEDGYWFI